jgi:peptidoglycan/xylan/chitin deacetylase (PgdA/CDA1 family)
VVLAYHNIVPLGAEAGGERALHLDQGRFGRQLDALSRTHDVVSLSEVMRAGAATRPRTVITFDDAYRGAVTAGVDELIRRGLPATIFVAPGFVGDGAFWWDALADPRAGVLDPAIRRHALERLAGQDRDVRAWAAAQGLGCITPPAHARVASEAELLAAARHPGITIGSHSWSHPNLAALTRDQVVAELRRSLTWLEERFAGVLRWLAYPYGLATPAVHETARTAGYEGALMVSGGWLGRHPAATPYALPRLNIPAGVSDAGFVMRTSGLLT